MSVPAFVRPPWRRAGRRYVWLPLIAVALIAAACGGGDDDGAAARIATTAPDATTAAPTDRGGAATGAGEGAAGFADGDLIEGTGAYDWRVTLVDEGTKPGIALDAAGNPSIAYMLERRGEAGWVRVATGGTPSHRSTRPLARSWDRPLPTSVGGHR